MNDKNELIKAGEALSERAVTGLFARAFSQPLKLLGQTEASLSSFAVFWCVAFNDRATQVEVSRLTGLSAKTVSRVISHLGETRNGKGWIRQEFDEQDRRVRRLSLSKKGKAVHARLMKDLAQYSNESVAA